MQGLAPEFVELGARWLDRFACERAERTSKERITLDLTNWLSRELWCVPRCKTAGQSENGLLALPLGFQARVD